MEPAACENYDHETTLDIVEMSDDDSVLVLRSDVERLVEHFDGNCIIDSNGTCQQHIYGTDCFVPRLKEALYADGIKK
jgi:hypothetical protein